VEFAHDPFGTALKDAQNKSKQDDGSTEIVQHVGFHPALFPVPKTPPRRDRQPSCFGPIRPMGSFPGPTCGSCAMRCEKNSASAWAPKWESEGTGGFFTWESN